MSNKIQLMYGLEADTNEIVSIEDVAKGKKCNCKCPSCEKPLIAKQGKIKQWHFAHESSDCKYATQTLAHLLAKDIVQENGFNFPKINGIDDSSITQFDSVMVEKRLGDIIPDLIVKIGNTEIIIEIAVTHFIDDVKKEKLLKLGIPTIEINLSHLKHVFLKDDLKKEILNLHDFRKQWIVKPECIIDYEKKYSDYSSFKYLEKCIPDYKEKIKKINLIFSGIYKNIFFENKKHNGSIVLTNPLVIHAKRIEIEHDCRDNSFDLVGWKDDPFEHFSYGHFIGRKKYTTKEQAINMAEKITKNWLKESKEYYENMISKYEQCKQNNDFLKLSHISELFI